MATYKGIQGYTVQSLASDPPGAQSTGQLWYNSASNVWKIGVEAAGAWAAGGALNQVLGSTKGFGTQTAAVIAGGVYEPGPSTANNAETYNGASWTTAPTLNTGRQAEGSLGISTAGFIVGGYKASTPASEVELWNGSTWSETTDITTARTSLRGCGSTTAGLVAGGYNAPPVLQMAITESWNGSSWTEVGDMNTRRSGAGIALSSPSTDTIMFAGYTQPPPNTADAETWNGTSWTETANLNSAKDNVGGSGTSSTSALCFGGRGPLTATESWNGTSWTEVADLALGRGYLASAGSATSALATGGEATGTPYYRGNTEMWSEPVYAAKTVTTS
jgi:hypothetical protein